MKKFITLLLTTFLLLVNVTAVNAETISTSTISQTQTPRVQVMQDITTRKDLVKSETCAGGYVAEVYTYYPNSDKLMYTFLLFDHNDKDSSYGRYAELLDIPTDVTSITIPDSITFNGYTYSVRDILLDSDSDYSLTSLTVPDTLYNMFIDPNVPNLKDINVPKIVDREPTISCSSNYTMSQFNINKVDYNKKSCDNFRVLQPLTSGVSAKDRLCDVKLGFYSYCLLNDGTAKISKYYDSLESTITVPSNVQFNNFNYLVTTVGNQSFSDYYLLNTIVLPSSVDTLESWALHNWSKPLTVFYSNPNLKYPTNVFYRNGYGSITYRQNPNEIAPSKIGIIATQTASTVTPEVTTPTLTAATVTSTSTSTATPTVTTSTAKTGDISALPVVLASLASIAGIGVFKKRK